MESLVDVGVMLSAPCFKFLIYRVLGLEPLQRDLPLLARSLEAFPRSRPLLFSFLFLFV